MTTRTQPAQMDLSALVGQMALIMIVAALFRMSSLLIEPETEHHSISWEAKRPLMEKYGKWAVELAEALCPENDVACVEREAKRLIEVRKYRGR
ncbi:MAG: hypothetical protein ACOC58_00330 [Chloroflexota bacterium]